MANFIEEFFYGNFDPPTRSKKQNMAFRKQMETLLNNEEKLTAAFPNHIAERKAKNGIAKMATPFNGIHDSV